MPRADGPRPISDLPVFRFVSRRRLQCDSLFPLMRFERIHGGEIRALLVEITIEAFVQILLAYIAQSVCNGFGLAVLSDLQICVLEKLHRMDLMLGAKMNGGWLLRGRDGREIRLNILLPQPKPGKYVGWHVQSVRRRRSNLRVTTRRRQSELRQSRIICRMN